MAHLLISFPQLFEYFPPPAHTISNSHNIYLLLPLKIQSLIAVCCCNQPSLRHHISHHMPFLLFFCYKYYYTIIPFSVPAVHLACLLFAFSI